MFNLWLRVVADGSLQRNQGPLHLIYTTPKNLHNSNPDVGQARLSSVPRRWIDPGLTLHYIGMIQFRSNVEPMLAQTCVRWVSLGATRITGNENLLLKEKN